MSTTPPIVSRTLVLGLFLAITVLVSLTMTLSFVDCAIILKKRENNFKMDHASHPYGFSSSSDHLKGENNQLISNYILVPTSKNLDKDLQFSHLQLKNESLPFIPNQKLSGNLIKLKTVSSHFQVLAPHGRCCQPSALNSVADDTCKERTSETAKENDCIVATNAGFFDVPNGFCLGRVVSNGKVLNDYGRAHPNAAFGLIDDGKGNSQYVFGYLNETDYQKLKITQMVQGVVWLVREGKSYLNESAKIEKTSTPFIEEYAPRVAIGNDSSGNLLILQMDGYEPLKWGLNLYQFTDLLLSLGFKNAINVDGGGSATTYIKDHDKLFGTVEGIINPSNPSLDTTSWDSENEIWFFQSAPLTGPSNRLGVEMRDGILTAFHEVNLLGGVWGGKQLKLLTLDDAYEPANTKVNTNFLLYNITPMGSPLNQAIFNDTLAMDEIRRRNIFGLIGFVGTPTVQNVFSDVLSTVIPLIGSFTGVGWLRSPFYPNIINIRASYDDETAAMVEWLVNVKLIRRISIMYQNDAFGNSGLSGINRSLVQRMNISLCSSGTFPRNTLQVENAFNTIGQCNPEAIVLIGTYAPLSKYIRLVKNVAFSSYNSSLGYNKANEIIFLTVSFVGSSALTEDLSANQPPSLSFGNTYYTDNVVISQVVPSPMDTSYSIVSSYQHSRKEYAKHMGIDPSSLTFTFIELEGYLVGKMVYTVLKKMVGSLTRSNFIASTYFDFNSGITDSRNAGGYFTFQGVEVGRYKYCNSVNLFGHFLSPTNQSAVIGSCPDNCNQGLKIIYMSNIELKNSSNISFSIFRDFSWYDTQTCISDTAKIQKQIIIGQSISPDSIRDRHITIGIRAALKKRNRNHSRSIELKTMYHDNVESLLKNTIELKTLHESVAFVGNSAESINIDDLRSNLTIDIRGQTEFSDIVLFGVRSTNSMALRNTFFSPLVHVFPSIMDQIGAIIDSGMRNGQNRISIVYCSTNTISIEVRKLLYSILDSIGILIDSEVDIDTTLSLDSILKQLSSNNANPHSILIALTNPDQIISIISHIKKTYSNSSHTLPLFRSGLSVYLINSLFESSVEVLFSESLSSIVDSNFNVKYVSHLPSYNSTLQTIIEFKQSMNKYFPSISDYSNNTAYLEGYIIGDMISAFIDRSGGTLDAKGLLSYMYSVQQVTSAGINFGKLSLDNSPCSIGIRTNYIYKYNQQSNYFDEYFVREYDKSSCGLVKYQNNKRTIPSIDFSSIEQPIVFARLIPFYGDETLASSKLSLMSDLVDVDNYSKGLSSYISLFNSKTLNQNIQLRTEYFGFTDSRWSLETKVKKMITRQKVFAFVGTTFSSELDQSTMERVKSILSTHKTPMLTTSNSVELRKPFSKYFINMRPSVIDEVATLISYFKSNGSIAILYHNVPYWIDGSIPLLSNYLEYNGISIDLFEPFNSVVDFALLGTTLKERKIQSIILISGPLISSSFISSLVLNQNTYTPNIGILSESYNGEFVSNTFSPKNFKSELFTRNFLYLPTFTIAPTIHNSDFCSLSTGSLDNEKQNSFISFFLANYKYDDTPTHITLEGYSTGFFIETLLNRIYQENGGSITQLEADDVLSRIYSGQTFDISGLNTLGPFGKECSTTQTFASNQTSCNLQTSAAVCDCNQAPRKVFLSRAIISADNSTSFNDVDYVFEFSTCGVSIVKPILSTTAIILISLAVFFLIILIFFTVSIIYVCKARTATTKNAPKTGNICCCFTDIQNSTVLWENCEKGMREGLKLHNTVLRTQLKEFRGFEVKTQGDCFYVVFKDPLDGLDWAIACQHELMTIAWPSELLQLYDCRAEFDDETKEMIWNGIRVRMGLHFGFAEKIFDKVVNRPDYFGNTINAAARIEASTEGGQILISEEMFTELWKNHGTSLFKSVTLQDNNQTTQLDPLNPSTRNINSSYSESGKRRNSKDFSTLFQLRGTRQKANDSGSIKSSTSEDRVLRYHAKDLGEFKLKGLQGMTRLFEIKSDRISKRQYSTTIRNTEESKLDILKQASAKVKSTRILPIGTSKTNVKKEEE